MKLTKSRFMSQLRVKDLLSKGVGGQEDARSVSQLHASDLTKQDPEFCPREVVLMRMLGVEKPPQYIAHAMRVTFDEGRDKQARVNNVYLRNVMVGGWECIRCNEEVHWGRAPDIVGYPEPCVSKVGHRWEYREPVFHHPSGFSGSIDAVVAFSEAKKRMVECKIIKGDDFKVLQAPLAEHRVRTQLYLRLIAESPDARTAELDVSEAHVLYIMRGHGVKDEEGTISPFREFIVKRDDAKVERYVRMANAVKGPMPEGICESVLCKRASKCKVAKECFSGKYPVINKWSADL